MILPLFACPGEGVRREVPSMPGVFNLSVDEIAREAAAAFDVGVHAVILFGLPESKDETASGAYADGRVRRTRHASKVSSQKPSPRARRHSDAGTIAAAPAGLDRCLQGWRA